MVYCEFLSFVNLCGDAKWTPEPIDLPPLSLTVEVESPAVHLLRRSFCLIVSLVVACPCGLVLSSHTVLSPY